MAYLLQSIVNSLQKKCSSQCEIIQDQIEKKITITTFMAVLFNNSCNDKLQHIEAFTHKKSKVMLQTWHLCMKEILLTSTIQ